MHHHAVFHSSIGKTKLNWITHAAVIWHTNTTQRGSVRHNNSSDGAVDGATARLTKAVRGDDESPSDRAIDGRDRASDRRSDQRKRPKAADAE